MVVSIGAFVDEVLYERVKKTAAEHNQMVYIASGAVGGFDVLRTAALMSPIMMPWSKEYSEFIK